MLFKLGPLKNFVSTLVLPATLALIGCDGDTKDPATAGINDLNPPGDVVSITRDGKIELRWSAGNVEEDFKGYYVFGIKKSDYDAKAKGKATYPKGKANPEVAGIPRCKDNSAFFEAFGLPKSESDCEGAPEESAVPTTGTKLTADDTTAAAEKLTGFLSCDEKASTTPSLPRPADNKPVVTPQTCTVSKIANTALANGTTYAFVVVAVADDDFSKISWTSKVIFDTPSANALTSTLDFPAFSGTVSNKFKITLDPTTGKATLGAIDTCNSAIDGEPCNALSKKNTLSTATSDIYISRNAVGTYLQRLYISAPAGGSVIIQPRGPQTYDPLKAAKTTDGRIPGDTAAKEFPSTEFGTKYVVYNNQIFDLEITKSGVKYYGKVFIGDVTYAGTGALNTLTASVKLSVVLQPGAGIKHYALEPKPPEATLD
jgi:hypothetical protein